MQQAQRVLARIITAALMLGMLQVAAVALPSASDAANVLDQVNEASYTPGSRGNNGMYQLIAPSSGNWDLVGAWNFNNATNGASYSSIGNGLYNPDCAGSNNSSADDTYGPTLNAWGAVEFNALNGYGTGKTIALKKRGVGGTSNSDSGSDTGINLTASITGTPSSGCQGVWEQADYYGGIVNPIAPSRRGTETLAGVAYVYPGKYFAVGRTTGAKWENTFSNLNPNTKYRFQFIYANWLEMNEEITSSASLNGVSITGTPERLSILSTGSVSDLTFRKNRITVTVRGYDTYTLTRVFKGTSNGAQNSMVLNAFTIYKESDPSTTTHSVSNSSPTFGSSVSLTANVTSGATGVVTFKDGSNNSLCTTGNLAAGSADCSWTPGSAATYVIRAVYGGDAAYKGSSSIATNVIVGKAAQTITFASPGSKVLGSGMISLVATSTSALTVAFTSATTGVCTISGTDLTLVAEGTCSVNANQTGNVNYETANQVQQSFSISKADQSITFGSIANKLLGINPFSLVASTSSALTVSFTSATSSVCTVASGQVTILATGTCTIKANQSGNGNFNPATEQTQSFNVTQIAITYDGNSPTTGSASRTSDSFSIDDPGIVLPTVGTLAKTGYEFDGWATSVGGSKIIGNYTPTSSGTLYARWVAKTYTTSFNINGAAGEAPTDIAYTSGNSGFPLPAGTGLSKSGYNFGGWSTTPTGSSLSGSQSPSNDQILYAVWVLKTVTATYDKGSAPTNPANFPAAASGRYNSTITLDSGMTDNYSDGGTTFYFQGWSDGTSTFKKGDTFRLGASDITLTAQWVAIYGVRYSLGGGTIAAGDYLYDEQCTVGDHYCSSNQSIQANSAPSRSGYNFTGWKDQSGNDIAVGASFTVSNSSYLLYAQWTAISRTVTYSLNYSTSDSAPTEASKTINQTFATASAPSRSGYTFKGWLDGSSLYGPSATYMVGLSNVTLTAQWAFIPLLAALNPTFSTPTTTTTGFTVQISNYDAAFTWDTATVTSGIVARDSFGLLTVTGLTAGQTSTLTQTTSRAAYNNGTGSVSSNATALLSPLNPTFSATTSTTDGFTVTITNFNSSFTWDTATVTSGIVSVTSTSGSNRLLTVTGLSAGASATITQATSRNLYLGGSGSVTGTAINATPIVSEQPGTSEPIAPAPVIQGPPPSILRVVSAPKISRDAVNLYCQRGKFIFLRESRIEESAKLSSQILFLIQNGKVVDFSESSSEKVAFAIKSTYFNTTLSCQIDAMQENSTAISQSLDFEMMSKLSKNIGQAITAADTKYYTDRAAAYSKKAQTFAELGKIKAEALAKAKNSKEIVKVRITYLKAFTAASNLWKQDLTQAASNRVIAKALAQKVYLNSLELAGISIYLNSN